MGSECHQNLLLQLRPVTRGIPSERPLLLVQALLVQAYCRPIRTASLLILTIACDTAIDVQLADLPLTPFGLRQHRWILVQPHSVLTHACECRILDL
jgi:hypothetical protein